MLELKLSTPFKNAPIFYKPETESTMIDGRNLASQGFPTGTLVVAGYQIAGRGRFPDRKWMSEPNESLLCTLILRDPPSTGPLPLKTGLALATFLEEEFELQPSIKWPNDVLVKDRKVAGILVETKEQVALIGIGLNCLQRSFPKELRKTATSLRKMSSRKFELHELIPPLLEHLHRWLLSSPDAVPSDPSLHWKTELEKRLYRKNETVWFLPGLPGQEEPIPCTLMGVTDEGQLLVRMEGSKELREFAAGEILFQAKT